MPEEKKVDTPKKEVKDGSKSSVSKAAKKTRKDKGKAEHEADSVKEEKAVNTNASSDEETKEKSVHKEDKEKSSNHKEEKEKSGHKDKEKSGHSKDDKEKSSSKDAKQEKGHSRGQPKGTSVKTQQEIEEEKDGADSLRLWIQQSSVSGNRLIWYLKEVGEFGKFSISRVQSSREVQKNQQLLPISPFGEIPALRVGKPDSYGVFSSCSVFDFVCHKFDKPSLHADWEDKQHALHSQYSHWFLANVDEKIVSGKSLTDFLTKSHQTWWRTVEKRLAEDIGSNQFIQGENLSLTDFVVAPTLWLADQHSMLTRAGDNVVWNYYKRIRAIPSFSEIFVQENCKESKSAHHKEGDSKEKSKKDEKGASKAAPAAVDTRKSDEKVTEDKTDESPSASASEDGDGGESSNENKSSSVETNGNAEKAATNSEKAESSGEKNSVSKDSVSEDKLSGEEVKANEEGASVPREDNTTPGEDSTTPREDSTTPREDSTTPREEGAEANEGSPSEK